MYGNLPNLVLAFHGCDEETYKKVLYDHEPLLPSINSYDWLGNGIYFGENSFPRAQEWAVAYCERSHKKYPDKEKKRPAVIGAVISLGHCLNLTDYGSSEVLKNGYEILAYELSLHGKELPINKNVKGNRDLLLRELDCAVIQLPPEQQENINKIIEEIKTLETNPFSTKESSMLEIDFEAYLKMVNTIINDLKDHENKNY